ncbi:hypothetical protein B2G52_08495 [Neisseria lactamica]|uniref:Uncharacterized protein n=1 Tax=Neisseria lactamica TaxID=486 RepID=A0AAU8VIL1_NEILA|nr:hypothetical protein B2G52_08495 [Neisseria lactamica]
MCKTLPLLPDSKFQLFKWQGKVRLRNENIIFSIKEKIIFISLHPAVRGALLFFLIKTLLFRAIESNRIQK